MIPACTPAAKEPPEGESWGSWTGGFSQQEQPLLIFPKMLFEAWWIYCLCCHRGQTCLTKYSLHRAHRQWHRDELPSEEKGLWDLKLKLSSLRGCKCSLSWRCCLWEGKWALPRLGFLAATPAPVPLHVLQSPAGLVAVLDAGLMNFLRTLWCRELFGSL